MILPSTRSWVPAASNCANEKPRWDRKKHQQFSSQPRFTQSIKIRWPKQWAWSLERSEPSDCTIRYASASIFLVKLIEHIYGPEIERKINARCHIRGTVERWLNVGLKSKPCQLCCSPINKLLLICFQMSKWRRMILTALKGFRLKLE